MLPDDLVRPVAQPQVGLHAPAPQVEVTVPKASLFAGLRFIVDGEGWALGFVEDQKSSCLYFHLTRGNLRVDGLRSPQYYFTFHPNNVFPAHFFRPVVRFGVDFRAANDLHYTRVVAQIQEDDVTEIPAAIHPPGQKHCPARMISAKLAAITGSLAVTKEIQFQFVARLFIRLSQYKQPPGR
jgi:hypothetical protein